MSDIIHVLDKRVELAQPKDGFRTSIDAILLAAACPAKAGDNILDLGCGLGSAALCVLRRVEGTSLTGIDILPEAVELSQHNAMLNKMEQRTHFRCVDIRDFDSLSFDHVICNPPYLDAGEHIRSPSEAKATAMGFGEDDMDLKDWIDCAHRSIQGQGSLTMVHRADALDDIIRSMGKRFGAIDVFPLWPRPGMNAKRVIVRARKNRKTGTSIHAGLALHEGEGYTTEAERILRDMEALL